MGKLRCLDALGDYPMLLEEAKGLKQKLHRPEFRAKPKWKEWVMQVRSQPLLCMSVTMVWLLDSVGLSVCLSWRQVLLLGTKAAFSLGQWQDMADFIATRSRVLPNEAFLVSTRDMVSVSRHQK